MTNLLSQGGFGCVYYPGLKCDNAKNIKSDKKYVTKLQRKNFTSMNESNIGQIIKEIKNYDYFFLPVISQCPINLTSYVKKYEEQLKECDVIKNTNKQYMLMKIPYIKSKPVIDAIFNDSYSKKNIFVSMLELYITSLNAIDILIEKNIVHFDLKSDNILYDTTTNQGKFIDFGLSIPINNINKDNQHEYFYIYAPEYFIWPLEVHVINFFIHEYKDDIVDMKYVNYISNEIAKEYTENNKSLLLFSEEFRNKYTQLCKAQIRKYIVKDKQTIIDNLISFNKTWDNYSLSILFLRILHQFFPNGFVSNNFYICFSQLLLYNIHPNPEKRLDIYNTINSYNDFFFANVNIQTYIETYNDININLKEAAGYLKIENKMLNLSINKELSS